MNATATSAVAMRNPSAVPHAAILGETLVVDGTPGPDQIRIMATNRIGFVRVISGTKLLGSYGPVAQIEVHAGAGSDSVVMDSHHLPTRLDGGTGNDRLRGGWTQNTLIGGPGNDVLTATPGRDTVNGDPDRRAVNLKGLGVIQVGVGLRCGAPSPGGVVRAPAAAGRGPGGRGHGRPYRRHGRPAQKQL